MLKPYEDKQNVTKNYVLRYNCSEIIAITPSIHLKVQQHHKQLTMASSSLIISSLAGAPRLRATYASRRASREIVLLAIGSIK